MGTRSSMADKQHSLATYLSDMLALEEHIRIPITVQAEDADFAVFTNAAALITRLSALCETHIQTIKSALEASGGHELAGAKSVVTNIEGWFAGAIDKMRRTKVAKALRDDYTALALCAVSYSMLISTANVCGDARVSELAQRHLRDYAELIWQIGDILPGIVVEDLRALGLPLQEGTAELTRRQIADAWHRPTTIENEAALNRGASASYPTA